MKTDTDPPSQLETAATIVSPRAPKRPETPSSPPSEGIPSAAPPMVAKGPGLGTKFFLAAALLVVTTLGLAVAVATIRANQVAEKSIRETLGKVPAVYTSYQSSIDGQLRASLRSIAEEPGTKSLLAPDVSNVTLWDWAQSKQQTLNAKTVFLFDRAGNILTRSDKPAGEDVGRPFKTVKWVLSVLETGGDATAKIREGKIVSTVASVPVVTGDMSKGEMRLDGVLAAAVPFDAARAKELQGLTRGQVGFLADTAKKGEPPSPEVAAATEDFRGEALVAALKASPGALDTLFVKGQEIGPVDVVVDGDRRIVKAVPIKRAEGETVAAFVVSRSRDEETAAFRQIRNTLIGVGLVALLVSIPVSLLMGRRIA
ncbi:MAG TPA: cache domain-containing protein, partial [Thermoanaerobaculia bacterium]|nr:cache domain-containing protein [Thermoanaerobaculia bacterium]